MRDGRRPRRGVRQAIEQLEVRTLLAVTPAEYASICSTYPDFALPASMAQINIIEVTPDQLSVANLIGAITTAGSTTLPDLVVLRTTPTQYGFSLATAADEMAINIPSTLGAISIVGFGSNMVSIAGGTDWRVFNVASSISTTTVNLGALWLSGGGPYGGAVMQSGGTLRIQDAAIRGGAWQADGGALYMTGGNLSLKHAILNGWAAENGGAYFQAGGTATFTDVKLSGYSQNAGVIYLGGGSLTLTAVDVTNPDGAARPTAQGGGIYCNGGTLTMSGGSITGCHAEWGGGIYAGSATLRLTGVAIDGNSALYGAEICQISGTMALTNMGVGGVYQAAGTSTLTNVTILGGISLQSSAMVTVNNSIMAAAFWTDDGASGQVSGSYNLISDGTGQTGFVNGVNGNLVGTSASPIDPKLAINAGNNALIPPGVTTDFNGLPRIVGGAVDMGAYEYDPPTPTNVTAAEYASIRSTYLDFGLPADMAQINIIEITPDHLTTEALQAALSAAKRSLLADLVVVRTTDANYSITNHWLSDVISIDAPISIVGFGTRRLFLSSTVWPEFDSHVISVATSAAVNLGGVQVSEGRSSCTAIQVNGSIRLVNTEVDATNATVNATNVTAAALGGGGPVAARNVVFNGLVEAGGTFTDVIFGNGGVSGGLRQSSGTSTLTNVTVTGCSQSYFNGFNYAYAGGVWLTGGTMTMDNCIIAQNKGVDITVVSPGSLSGSNNLVGNGTGETNLVNGVNGNLVGTPASPINPRFVDTSSADPTQWNLHLRSDSPAVNAGSNALIPVGITTDLGGGPRIVGGTVDMGAYEYAPAPTVTGFMVNDGSVQRSTVTKLVVTFSTPVTIADRAISLLKRNGAIVPNVVVNKANPLGDQMTWELTFSGLAVTNGSLPDGTYRLVIGAAGVADLSGTPMASAYHHKFYRLFGDSDGNRVVNRSDLEAMRNVLNQLASAAWWFDYDGNGTIDVNDLRQLRARLRRALL